MSAIKSFSTRGRFSLVLKVFLLCLVSCNYQLFSQPLAEGHNKFLGNVYGNSTPPANWDSYWNQVTPENAGKWLYREPSRDNYNWGGADNVYNFAKQRGIPFKYHALVWGEQRPSWISTLDSAEQAEETEEWIRIIGERYPDMEFVDVVNEPLPGHDPNGFKEALGGAGETGYDWVIWAFEKARQYMPNTKLLINDFNILLSNSNTTTYLQIINLLKDRGLIDGISAQCHRSQIENASNATIEGNLDRLAATGLPIYISEMDLGNFGNTGTPNDSVQLSLYQRIFPILWEHPGVAGITLWGYIEGQMYQSTAFLLRSNGRERPALQWLREYLKSVLPVELTSFTALASKNEILLNWTTATETNNYGFEIQRKHSSNNFVTIGFVKGNGTTSEVNGYYFYDRNFSNGKNIYRLKQIDYSGTFEYSNEIEVTSIPNEYSLEQNYPNPFNPSTIIKYNLRESSKVKVNVYNITGVRVRTLVNSSQEAGEYSVVWDGLDDNGNPVSSGVYLYRLEAGDKNLQRKMILIR